MSRFKVGDTVRFGRPTGEKTLGKVTKINRKTITVETLEARGRNGRTKAGHKWRVHPSLCEKADSLGRVPMGSSPKKDPYRSQDLVLTALAKLTTPEIEALKSHFRKGFIDSSLF